MHMCAGFDYAAAQALLLKGMQVIKGFPGHPSADDQVFLGELTLVLLQQLQVQHSLYNGAHCCFAYLQCSHTSLAGCSAAAVHSMHQLHLLCHRDAYRGKQSMYSPNMACIKQACIMSIQ